jgi:hypothetical protein
MRDQFVRLRDEFLALAADFARPRDQRFGVSDQGLVRLFHARLSSQRLRKPGLKRTGKSDLVGPKPCREIPLHLGALSCHGR